MIPADVVTLAGNYTITVVNAANAQGQGGGESTTSAPFTILNPAPTITSLTPNPATVFAPFTLEVQGTGFVSGATSVTVDGQVFAPGSVTVLSPVRLTVNVAAITSAKNASVSITNPKLNNQGGGTATTTLPVVPPVPTVSQAQGSTIGAAGGGTLTRNIAGTLTVTGTGFVTGAVIVFNGQDLTTTVVDQTTVRANVAASVLPTHGVYAVAVRNPQFGNQGGGTSSPVVGVTVQNPTPTLSGINPTAITRGNDASITLTGGNFYDGVVAYLSGASASTFATVFVNNGSLTLSIPASSLPVAGSYSIAIKNSEPTPGFSGTKTLTVNNPAPVLSSLSVTEAQAYSDEVTLSVTGSGFENGLMAWWTPSGSARQALPAPTSVSANSCTLTIPAALLTRAGAFTITLENAAPSLGASAPSTFTVLDRIPTLTSVAPNPIEALSGNTQITLTGDYFAPNADALWNGEILTRVSVNRTTLVATVPASRLLLATVAQITVRNPVFAGRGGGTSTPAQNLVITNPTPRLTSLTPAFTVAVTSGTGAVVTLNGTDFMPVSTVEMSVSDSAGTPSGVWSVFPSTYQSASRISVLLPDSLLHQPAVFTLRVVSPQVNTQGGGTSEERLFTVRAPVPVLTALVPTVATLNAQTGDVLVRVEGANFTNTSLVRVANVPVPTKYLSPTALEATVQRPAAAYTVTVNNPPVNAQGGGTSSGLRLVIVNPLPTLTAVQPATLASTGAPDTVTLKGTNFITGVKVLYNGTALAAASVTVLNDSTLRVLIPTLPIAVTTHTLAVQQPSVITGGETFGGGASQTLPLSIVFPVPTLTSLSPQNTAATLNPNAALNHWTLTVRGTLFASNAVVLWNGQALTTNVVNSTTLRALVPNSLAHDSGTVVIRVKSNVPSAQGGGTSADSLTLGLYYPVPVLTGIAPEFTTAATLTRLTLTGTNFAPGSGVQLAATFLPAVMLGDVQVISPTELQASIPASLLSTRGTYSVRVISPQTASAQGGGQSAAKTLTAVNPAPVLTALLPNTTTASGKPWTLTLVGRSFTATSQVRYNGVLQSVVNTDFIPNVQADTLRVKLPAVPVNDTTFFLSVYNPPSTVNGQPSGGGESDTLRLTIGLPSPTITSISPTTTTATLGDRVRVWTLTINGTFFDNTAKVFVSGVEVPTEFVATTRLRVVLPDSMQFYQARRSVQVKNTPTLISTIVSLTVQNPAPVLTAMNPSTILAGRDTTIVLTGDRFAPNSTVRLTYGTTNTFLTPTLRDSVIGLTVNVPGALTRTKGAYTLRVSNPALTPTMVPPDTLLLGGGLSAAQTLTVNAGSVTSVEYIGLDTLLYAGDRLWFFTLRFRDAVGNLVDNDPVTLNYTNLDSTSIYGTFPMTRTSLGNYRADTLRFPVAGVYALTVDTTQTGTLTVIGANRFTVLTRPAVRVEMTGLKETLSAGETQHVQVRYYDNQNNLTDNSVRPVIVTAPLTGGYRYVLGYTRMSTGVYDMETVRYTTSGNYTISFTGIDTLNITGNGVPYNRRFTVQTISAASVRFTNVNPFLTAGNAQNRFTAAFRDTFGNLTDALTTEQLVVNYTNSTGASVGDSIVTGSITLSRLSLGTYQADVAERFPVVGSYNFTVLGISSTSGTAAFRVQPAGDARVEFAGVRDTLVAGDSLTSVTLKYWDVNGNLTDNNLGDIILTKRSPAPTFPARMAKTRISTGVYAVQTTQATISGNYDLTVVGISAANTSGNKNIVVVPAAVTNVDFVITTTAMTRTGARASITATYHDRFGNLADFAGDLTLSNSEYASVATVSMTRSRLGVYTGTIVLYAPGSYAVQIAGNSANITIGGTEAFALEPGPAVRADFQNVLPALTAGGLQSAFTVLLRDRRGSPTDVWNGDLSFAAPASGVTGTVSYDWDNGNPAMYGVITATPTTFTKSGTYTLSLNGGITQHVGTRTFAVASAPAQTAFILTTPPNATVTAGGTVGVRVRFTDSFGNLTPVTSTIALQQNGTTLATVQLAATGIKGEYTAAFRPATSGTLTFALETPVVLAGTTAITVLPTTDYRVELNGVKTNMIAGETQNPFTVTYRDRYGNLTDSTVGAVIVRLVGGTERDTLQMQRLAKGEYRAEALTVTKVGTYLITISGISTLNITGDSAFVVTPDVAAQAVFQSVPTAINVNANLPAFTVRYRDRFDNPVDYNGTVGFTNSASPFVQAGLTPLNAQAIPVTRTALAVSTATLTPVSVAGDYALTVQGLTTLTGTTVFTVRPLAAASAEIRNVQERVSAGDSLPPFIVLYRDKAGNVTEYNRNLTLTRTGTTASLTVPMKRIAIGVSTASVATELVTPGTYRLSVPGLTTVSGATTVVVVSTNAVSKVDFWGVTPTLTAGSTQAAFSVTFQNAQGGFVDFTTAIVRYQNSVGTSSGTLALTKQDVGVYSAEILPFTKIGTYRFIVVGISTTTGTSSFLVSADSTYKAVFTGVTTASIVGQTIPPFDIQFYDQYNNPSLYHGKVSYSIVDQNIDSTVAVITQEGSISKIRVANIALLQTGTYIFQAENISVTSGNTQLIVQDKRPEILSIYPSELTFGSSSTVTISGTSFQPSSKFMFGDFILDTQIIDSNNLQVIIPSELTYLDSINTVKIVNSTSNTISDPKTIFVKNNAQQTSQNGNNPQYVLIDAKTNDVLTFKNVAPNYYDGSSTSLPFTINKTTYDDTKSILFDAPVVATANKDSKGVVISYDLKVTIPSTELRSQFRYMGSQNEHTFSLGAMIKFTAGLWVANPLQPFPANGTNVDINALPIVPGTGISPEKPLQLTLTIPGSDLTWETAFILQRDKDDKTVQVSSTKATSIDLYGSYYNLSAQKSRLRELLGEEKERNLYAEAYNPNSAIPGGIIGQQKDPIKKTFSIKLINSRPRLLFVTNPDNSPTQYPYVQLDPNNIAKKYPVEILGYNLRENSVRLVELRELGSNGLPISSIVIPFNQLQFRTQNSYDKISFEIPASELRTRRNLQVFIQTPDLKWSEEVAYFYILKPIATITQLNTPATITANSPVSLEIIGNYFVPSGSIITINGNTTNAATITSTKITATIPGNLVNAGYNQVAIVNPNESINIFAQNKVVNERNPNVQAATQPATVPGRPSNIVEFFAEGIRPGDDVALVTPMKVIASPTAGKYDTAFTITGTNLYKKSFLKYKEVRTLVNESLTIDGQVVSKNTHILPSGMAKVEDNLYISNRNPSRDKTMPDGYYDSKPIPFNAYDEDKLPSIETRSVSPRQSITESMPIEVTVKGKNFVDGAKVRLFRLALGSTKSCPDASDIKGIYPAVFVSNTELKVTIPSELRAEEGRIYIQALNSDDVGLHTYWNNSAKRLSCEMYGLFVISNSPPKITESGTRFEKIVPTYFLNLEWLGIKTGTKTEEERKSEIFTGILRENPAQKDFFVKGENFEVNDGTTVRINDQIVPTQVKSSTELWFGNPFKQNGNDVKYFTFRPGEYTLTVENGLRRDESEPFSQTVLSPVPSIETVSRENTPGQPLTNVTLDHTGKLRVLIYSGGADAPYAKNFTENSRVLINNKQATQIQLQSNNGYSLFAILYGETLKNFALNELVIENPPLSGKTDGGKSKPYYFRANINYPKVVVESLTPSRLEVGEDDETLTIQGNEFTPNSIVSISRYLGREIITMDAGIPIYEDKRDVGTLSWTLIAPNKLQVQLPKKWRSRVGVDTITVCNPGVDACASKELFLKIVDPRLVVTALSPNVVDARIDDEPLTDQTLTITGQNLQTEAPTRAYILDGEQQTEITVSETLPQQLKVVFPANDLRNTARNTSLRIIQQHLEYGKVIDTSQTETPIAVAYKAPIIEGIEPDFIEVVSLPISLAYKTEGELTSAQHQQEEFPVYAGLPTTVEFYPNAPNPFDASTTLRYALPYDAHVVLEIFDIFGRSVTKLVDRQQKAGLFEIPWQPHFLAASGTYQARLLITDRNGKLTHKTITMTRIR